MQGARSAATKTYQVDKRGSEHRATQQMTIAVVFQHPVKNRCRTRAYALLLCPTMNVRQAKASAAITQKTAPI